MHYQFILVIRGCIRVLMFDLLPNCAVNGSKRDSNEENRVLSLNIQPMCEEFGLQKGLTPTKVFHLLALELSPICPTYMFEVRLVS